MDEKIPEYTSNSLNQRKGQAINLQRRNLYGTSDPHKEHSVSWKGERSKLHSGVPPKVDNGNLGETPHSVSRYPLTFPRFVCANFFPSTSGRLALTWYWHTEMKLVLLKQWSPMFDLEK